MNDLDQDQIELLEKAQKKNPSKEKTVLPFCNLLICISIFFDLQ